MDVCQWLYSNLATLLTVNSEILSNFWRPPYLTYISIYSSITLGAYVRFILQPRVQKYVERINATNKYKTK